MSKKADICSFQSVTAVDRCPRQRLRKTKRRSWNSAKVIYIYIFIALWSIDNIQKLYYTIRLTTSMNPRLFLESQIFRQKVIYKKTWLKIPKIPKIHRISIHMAPFEPKVGGKFVFLLSISILQNQFLAKYE